MGGGVREEGILQEPEEGGGDTVYADTVVDDDVEEVRVIAEVGYDSSNALGDVLVRTLDANHQDDGPHAWGLGEMAVILLPEHGS